MGAYWLHSLPRYLDKWGVKYQLVPGWESRSRSSGGFDEIRGIGIHHDASSPAASLQGVLDYAYKWSPDKPIGNGFLWRDGVFHLAAAGATNTQGKGGPVHTSRGVIPRDDGNRYLFSIEAGNNGTGEPWPKVQTDAYVLLCVAVLDCINSETPGAKLGPGDIFAHFEWAPGRKIDPLGPSPWASGADMWNMDAFRGDVFKLMVAGLEPATTPDEEEEDEMIPPRLIRFNNDPATFIWFGNGEKTYLRGKNDVEFYRAELKALGLPTKVYVYHHGKAEVTGRVSNYSLIKRHGYNPYGAKR